jgi:hypothetical protein
MLKKVKSVIFEYPDPDKIQINKANLELKLRDYGGRIKDKFSWQDLLFVVPAWAILFTSNFNNSVWILSGEELKGIYIASMVLGTVGLFKNKIPFVKKIFNKNDAIEAIEDIVRECN